MPRLEILVGMIASGKSTYCKMRARDGALVVNDDAVVTALHGGNYDLYTEALRPLYKLVRTTMIRAGLMMGRDVVVDSTNLTTRRREKMVELAKECNAEPIAVVFPFESPEIHASRRWRTDNRGCSYEKWLAVARHHAKQYEPVVELDFEYPLLPE